MKKNLLLSLLIALAATLQAQAAEADGHESNAAADTVSIGGGTWRWYDRFYADLALTVGMPQGHTWHYMPTIGVGYDITRRFHAFADFNFSIGYYQKDGVKAYRNSPSIGGGLGWTVWQDKGDPMGGALDLRASAGGSVGYSTWKHTYYDLGLRAYTSSKTRPASVFVGLGARFMDSHTAGVKNYTNAYATVGVRF